MHENILHTQNLDRTCIYSHKGIIKMVYLLSRLLRLCRDLVNPYDTMPNFRKQYKLHHNLNMTFLKKKDGVDIHINIGENLNATNSGIKMVRLQIIVFLYLLLYLHLYIDFHGLFYNFFVIYILTSLSFKQNTDPLQINTERNPTFLPELKVYLDNLQISKIIKKLVSPSVMPSLNPTVDTSAWHTSVLVISTAYAALVPLLDQVKVPGGR